MRSEAGGEQQKDSRSWWTLLNQRCLTLTFESLPGESPQQRPAVFAEGRTLVVVDFEPVRHVDLEALLVELKHT